MPPSVDETELLAAYDELSLWSAPFGLKLLERVELRPGAVALDVGCGTGFPLLELAQRLGASAHVHGVDCWGPALSRVRDKLRVYRLERNVSVSRSRAEQLPLADGTVDLIVSNNGLNNVQALDAALAECARVARPGAQLVYSYNLPGSMQEFYDVYDGLLRERGLERAQEALAAHLRSKRKPIEVTTALLERVGFHVEEVFQETFCLRFVDASAMFDHALMRVAFIPAWLELLEPELRRPLFAEIARRLDVQARDGGGLTLTVPFACLDCRRAVVS